jgi:exonuclease SbcD
VRFLHTSDWHVGKSLKGHNRLDEQREVIREIIEISKQENVDAVLIAGDLYETSAPSANAQRLVVQALLALRATGAEVLVIAGNHDHAGTFQAYQPLMAAAGISVLGYPQPAGDGGIVSFTAASTGEKVNVGMLPFVSQRYSIKAVELLAGTPADNAGKYDQRIREMIDHLKSGFTSDAVNIIMAHLTVTNGKLGGGERPAQSIFEYHVPASAFGVEPHYVALGHLHRHQRLAASCPVYYSGAPLAVDFGEEDNTSVVLLVDAAPDVPATVTDIRLTAGRRLRTVRGTVKQLMARASELKGDYLRVYVSEPHRAGLFDQVREVLPDALEVRIDPDFATSVSAGRSASRTARLERTAGELLAEYCTERNVEDPRVTRLFGQLHDEATV